MNEAYTVARSLPHVARMLMYWPSEHYQFFYAIVIFYQAIGDDSDIAQELMKLARFKAPAKIKVLMEGGGDTVN